MKIVYYILVTMLVLSLNSCEGKSKVVESGKVIIPDFLLQEEKEPKKPKVHQKLKTEVANYIVDYKESLENANLKLKFIRFLYYLQIGKVDKLSDFTKNKKEEQ